MTHKNLPTGLNGFKSFQSTFQNIAKQYNDVVTLRLYSMVSHKYVEVALTSFTLYHPINSVSIVLTHITGFNQTYCKIPRLIIKNVVGSDISIAGKIHLKMPGWSTGSLPLVMMMIFLSPLTYLSITRKSVDYKSFINFSYWFQQISIKQWFRIL